MTGGTSLDESQSDWWLQHRHRVSHHRILDPSYYNNTRGQTVKPKSQEICPSPLSTRVCVWVGGGSQGNFRFPQINSSPGVTHVILLCSFFFVAFALTQDMLMLTSPFCFHHAGGKTGLGKDMLQTPLRDTQSGEEIFHNDRKIALFLQSIPPPVLAPCLWKTIKIFADMSAVRSAKCCLLPRGIRFQFLKCFYGYRRTHYLEWWWCRPAAED